ncbi:hypothetical protein MANI_029080 [Metarhizium anisopliae]|nr:hypothetical protein MANI_029080 [Metarhizium anisopliae]
MKYTHEDYTVALICALSTDFTASTAMLDEKHPKLPVKFQCRYTLGQIGPHNVVIASLPHGTTHPWEVDYLLHNFPNIRFGLMVGVGGGAPATPSDDPNKDIRLGDVVVSHSEGNHGGVLRYGTGEMTQRCFFYKPPAILTTAVSELRSRTETVRSAISRHISDMMESNPSANPRFRYQGHEHDRLFEADYEHKEGDKDCSMCDEERLVHRKLRDTEHPVIHYGVIGSVGEDMRHSATREKLRQEHGILCFETVADGLMLNFPCLFIRGICDYFNTHKNEGWKEYAAITAAAYAKELLQIIPADQVACAEKALEIMKQMPAEAGPINKDLERLLNEQQRKERDDILDLIMSSPTYEDQHKDILKQRHPGTGQWFLESREFTEWLWGDCQSLYCPGIPGAGKTVLASIAIEHLRAQPIARRRRPVAFIYCNSQMQEEQSVRNLLCMNLHQLLSQCASIPVSVKAILESSMIFGEQPSIPRIIDAILEVIVEKGGSYLVIDGLDQLLKDGFQKPQRYAFQQTRETWNAAWLAIYRLCVNYVRDDADLWKEVKADIIRAVKGSFLDAIRYLTPFKE